MAQAEQPDSTENEDGLLPVSRRAVLAGLGVVGLSGASGAAAGATSANQDVLRGGAMALSAEHNVAGDLWIGPDANKSNVSADAGRMYFASDTETVYYGDSGSWVSMGTIGSGGGGGAPTDASYVTVSKDGTLTDERTINATGSLTQTDNGANNNLDLDVSDDGITATEIASGAVGSTQLATDAAGGTEINLSDIAGSNISVDATNDELDASAGVSQVATGTVTATGGSSPAVNTTLTNVSTTQTLDYWLTVHVDSDPSFNADYAFNYDYYHQWDDSDSQLDINLIVNWDTDPGSSNDVTLRWEVLQ
jgi:hypothetical protein